MGDKFTEAKREQTPRVSRSLRRMAAAAAAAAADNVLHESFCGLGLLFITINLGSPYPKKHLRRAQSPRRDIDIGTRLHSWNFTIFRFCEGSFAFSARIFFLHRCCPHLLLLFPTLPRQWRFCHGCFSALRVSIYFIPPPSQQFSSLLEIVAKLCSHVAPKFCSNSCVPQCPEKQNKTKQKNR